MTNEQAIKIKAGQEIRVYDGESQTDRIEKVTRVEKSAPCYGTVYIYSMCEKLMGSYERLSTPREIKELYT